MQTTVKFIEYDITSDAFRFMVTEPNEAPYKLSMTGGSVADIFKALSDINNDVAPRERCIAMCLEGTDENGDDTGEYTDQDPCELVGTEATY